MKILAMDMSYAKSGFAVLSVKDGDDGDKEVAIESAWLTKTNTGKSPIPRIEETLSEIMYVAAKINPDAIIKEESVVGQASTATNILKLHGVVERELIGKYRMADVNNATVKAWARRVTESDGRRGDKKMVGEAVEKYFNRVVPEIWTPRGALKDDVADAIAVGVYWLEKHDYIKEKYPKKKR